MRNFTNSRKFNSKKERNGRKNKRLTYPSEKYSFERFARVMGERIIKNYKNTDLRKSLLFKIPYGIIIRISDEIFHPLCNSMPLKQIHQLGPIPLHLLTGTHGTKRNFREPHLGIASVADSADDFLIGIFLSRIRAQEGQ